MKNLRQLIEESINTSSKLKLSPEDEELFNSADEAEPSSQLKAEIVLEICKKRYCNIFNEADMKISRNNNVMLCNAKDNGSIYSKNNFTIYLNTDYNKGYLLRRQSLNYAGGPGTQAKLIKNKETLKELIEKFDELLKKYKYNVNI